MILTGEAIARAVEGCRVIIDPYDPDCIEPNSYRFHLGERLMVYANAVVDAFDDGAARDVTEIVIPETGFVLEPGRFYLGHTVERMGSLDHAAELYARLSTGLAGIFIQTSAPLGHTGAIIPWTLEITVAQAVRVYPRMPIGKICFWVNYGEVLAYAGRYTGSTTVVQSRLSGERP